MKITLRRYGINEKTFYTSRAAAPAIRNSRWKNFRGRKEKESLGGTMEQWMPGANPANVSRSLIISRGKSIPKRKKKRQK